jgi:tripartite-type tricarboxylate transporter receptor subunit TctC
MKLRRVFAKAIVMLAATTAAAAAWAGYPERPIRVIIPFAPGGGTDVVGRLVAERLGHATGHSFIAENKPGANAAIGANFVAKAPADGYTVLLGTSAELTMVPKVAAATPYNPLTDFVPIVMLGSTPNILLASSGQPFKDVRELIAHAKANPDKLSYASGGMGPYLTGELFKHMAAVQITNVSYQGTGPAHTDLMGGTCR